MFLQERKRNETKEKKTNKALHVSKKKKREDYYIK